MFWSILCKMAAFEEMATPADNISNWAFEYKEE